MDLFEVLKRKFQYSDVFRNTFTFDIADKFDIILSNNIKRFVPFELKTDVEIPNLRFFNVFLEDNNVVLNGCNSESGISDEKELKYSHEMLSNYKRMMSFDLMLVMSNSKNDFLKFKLQY